MTGLFMICGITKTAVRIAKTVWNGEYIALARVTKTTLLTKVHFNGAFILSQKLGIAVNMFMSFA